MHESGGRSHEQAGKHDGGVPFGARAGNGARRGGWSRPPLLTPLLKNPGSPCPTKMRNHLKTNLGFKGIFWYSQKTNAFYASKWGWELELFCDEIWAMERLEAAGPAPPSLAQPSGVSKPMNPKGFLKPSTLRGF